ncbi:Uroporphyrinogen-III C-methyltransferase [Pseudozyma hubeiensis]|nr:Uroporphyrinogen-III C-methyltransferase [Pseudozyma hubeiensis]
MHFPEPNPTASLLLSHRPPAGKVALVLGTGKLAASRCFACLEAGIKPVVISVAASTDSRAGSSQSNQPCAELSHRIACGQVIHHTVDPGSFSTKRSVETTWDSILDSFDGDDNAIFAVCVTDTLHSGDEAPTKPNFRTTDGDDGDDQLISEKTLTSYARAEVISRLCRKRRIPINVADKPILCDFSFPANYRFPCTSPVAQEDAASSHSPLPSSSSLQIAVTTNGRGCRLAGRIRREIVSALPLNVGDAVEKVGLMRDLAKRQSEAPGTSGSLNDTASSAKRTKRRNKNGTAEVEEEDLSFDATPLNSPVPQLTPRNPIESIGTSARLVQLQAKHGQELLEAEERTKRRMRWVAQISEYWPIEYLGNLGEQQMNEALRAHGEEQSHSSAVSAEPVSSAAQVDQEQDASRGRSTVIRSNDDPATPSANGTPIASAAHRARSQHSLDIRPPQPASTGRGHIYLLGSGPGHPGLLTTFAYKLLTSASTDLILSDKLVPASILKLIPASTPLEIAKKFPGNAEGAQSELIAKALRAALEEGKTVVRLKQGDPFVYGRGGEEVLAFRNAGIECTVVPGISSSIAAPAMLGIPVTQRGAADSLVLCTGVGKGGKKVKLPGYDRGRTLIVLMGVARLRAVVATLTGGAPQSTSSGVITDEESIGDREGAVFPPNTPIAIIERASSSDQRMVASTLDGIVEALENSGEQRPPGMMVIGWSVLSLEGKGDVSIQDDAIQAESKEELDSKDKKRVDAWLKGRRWIVREGLDEKYRAALSAFHSTPLQFADAGLPLLHDLEEKGKEGGNAVEGKKEAERFSSRDESGWAPARYPTGVPEGGWVPGEAPNRPATDQLAYEQDKTYAEIQARLRQ